MCDHDANDAPRMTVRDLIRDLSRYPSEAQVVVRYDADVVEDADLEVFEDDGKVVIRTDAACFRR